VTVAKAMNNQEKTFVAATATVGLTVYSSNQPSVLIPGTGGPADVSVSVPSSVTIGGTIEGNIIITNVNPDIGQDFTIDYMITSLDETSTYSSGQKTIYVAADSTNSTLGPLTAPDQTGTYKYKAVVYWFGDSRNASASFTVVGHAAPTVGVGGGFVGIAGKGKIEITEYPVEMAVEQGGVEFYSLLVKNTGTASIHNVAITLDGIPQEWYLVIPENVDEILRGKSQVFILKITTPLDAEPKLYPVDIKASCDEGVAQVSMNLEVMPTVVEEAFKIVDVKILTQKLFLNEKGKVITIVKNIGSEDLNVVAYLTLPEGWSIDEKVVAKAMPPKTESTLEFNIIPIEIGAHTLLLSGMYNGKEFSKKIHVYVDSRKPIAIVSTGWVGFIFLIVLMSAIMIYGMKRREKFPKQELEKLKETMREMKIKKSIAIYTCVRCGNGIGYYDARSYKGKVYCIKCLVNMKVIK